MFPNLIFLRPIFVLWEKHFTFYVRNHSSKTFPFFLTKPSFFVFVFLRTIFLPQKNITVGTKNRQFLFKMHFKSAKIFNFLKTYWVYDLLKTPANKKWDKIFFSFFNYFLKNLKKTSRNFFSLWNWNSPIIRSCEHLQYSYTIV